MPDTPDSETRKDDNESCIQGISRQEFIKKILLKATAAGTAALLLEANAVRIRTHSSAVYAIPLTMSSGS